jgi:hypothetical protein
VLLKRLLIAKGLITLIAFEDMDRRVEVLVQKHAGYQGPIAIIALAYWVVNSGL